MEGKVNKIVNKIMFTCIELTSFYETTIKNGREFFRTLILAKNVTSAELKGIISDIRITIHTYQPLLTKMER